MESPSSSSRLPVHGLTTYLPAILGKVQHFPDLILILGTVCIMKPDFRVLLVVLTTLSVRVSPSNSASSSQSTQSLG
jgi:hypothetical protein